jgi:hypothetical protein
VIAPCPAVAAAVPSIVVSAGGAGVSAVDAVAAGVSAPAAGGAGVSATPAGGGTSGLTAAVSRARDLQFAAEAGRLAGQEHDSITTGATDVGRAIGDEDHILRSGIGDGERLARDQRGAEQIEIVQSRWCREGLSGLQHRGVGGRRCGVDADQLDREIAHRLRAQTRSLLNGARGDERGLTRTQPHLRPGLLVDEQERTGRRQNESQRPLLERRVPR